LYSWPKFIVPFVVGIVLVGDWVYRDTILQYERSIYENKGNTVISLYS
jgi:hypothetical protein